MINPHDVQADLAHQRQIGIHLFGPAEIISFRIRLERTVRDAFDEKLSVAFEEKFRDRANSRGFAVSCQRSSISPCCSERRISNDFLNCSRRNDSQDVSLRST